MLIDIRDITKIYEMGAQKVRALDGVSLEVDAGRADAMVYDQPFLALHTHEEDIAAHARRIVRLLDGKIRDDGPNDRAAAQARLSGAPA